MTEYKDIEFTPSTWERVISVHRLMEEQCGDLPISFAILLEFLKYALEDIEKDDEYEIKKDVLLEYIDSITEFHGKLAN